MLDWFENIGPVWQTLMATVFTWGLTALGAAPALAFRRIERRLLGGMLGFAGGVMLAAACWSLLIPALEQAGEMGLPMTPTVTGGFMCGGILMLLGDRALDVRKRCGKGMDKCSRLLMVSITLHNIPEGLCVGVAFGAAAAGTGSATLSGAWLLALGIGLQNFPEGAAVSLPMLRGGMSRRRAFFMGQLSGSVEPVSGILGAALVIYMRWLLPFLLAFAAGAMVYAVAGEILPQSREDDPSGAAAVWVVAGFALMMALDVALG